MGCKTTNTLCKFSFQFLLCKIKEQRETSPSSNCRKKSNPVKIRIRLERLYNHNVILLNTLFSRLNVRTISSHESYGAADELQTTKNDNGCVV